MGATRTSCAIRPPGRFFRALGLALALALVAGCRFDGASLEEKRASFRPLAAERVDGVPLERFLAERTAAIFPGNSPLGMEDRADGPRTRFAEERIHLGAAVALARDGYFLTAAHCADEAPLFACVALLGGGHALLPARVVWAGDPESDDRDLALVHVDALVAAAFDWADDDGVREDDVLVAAGERYVEGPVPVFAAGPALGPLPGARASEAAGPRTAEVFHGVPLRKGDSGGPLATRDGRLVGVNVRGEWILGIRRQVAIRPDPAWVAAAIARDRAASRERAAARPAPAASAIMLANGVRPGP